MKITDHFRRIYVTCIKENWNLTTCGRFNLGAIPHTRLRARYHISLQALSLVEKADLVQVRFTLRLRGPTEYVNARWM